MDGELLSPPLDAPLPTRAGKAVPGGSAIPALAAAAGGGAQRRFLEFFTANIRNPHTRRAYGRAVAEFLAWCQRAGVPSLPAVQPLHVAAWIEAQTRERSAPTVKQRLAAVRHLFDWLVTGQVVPVNPAASVRGPSHSVRVGKTPVLDPSEARQLLDGIDVTTPARPGADRAHGLQLRPRRRGARHEGRGRVHPEPPPLGAAAREGRQGALFQLREHLFRRDRRAPIVDRRLQRAPQEFPAQVGVRRQPAVLRQDDEDRSDPIRRDEAKASKRLSTKGGDLVGSKQAIDLTGKDVGNRKRLTGTRNNGRAAPVKLQDA